MECDLLLLWWLELPCVFYTAHKRAGFVSFSGSLVGGRQISLQRGACRLGLSWSILINPRSRHLIEGVRSERAMIATRKAKSPHFLSVQLANVRRKPIYGLAPGGDLELPIRSWRNSLKGNTLSSNQMKSLVTLSLQTPRTPWTTPNFYVRSFWRLFEDNKMYRQSMLTQTAFLLDSGW